MTDTNPFTQFAAEPNPFDTFDTEEEQNPFAAFGDEQVQKEISTLNGNPEQKETVFVEGPNQTVELNKGGTRGFWEFIGKSYSRSSENVERNDLGFNHIFLGGIQGQDLNRFAELSARKYEDLTPEGKVEYATQAITEQFPVLLGLTGNAIKRGAVGAAGGAGAGFLAGNLTGVGLALPEEILTVPGGAVIGAKGGLTFGALEFGFRQMTYEAYNEFSQFKDEEGNPLDPRAAKIGALMAGGVNAGFEALPFGMIFKMVPGSEKLFGKIGVKATDALGLPKSTGAMRKFLFNISKVAAVEGLTEVSQEGTNITVGELLKDFSGRDFKNITPAEIESRLTEAGIKGAIAGAGISAPVAAVDAAISTRGNNNTAVETETETETVAPKEPVAQVADQVETAAKDAIAEVESIQKEVDAGNLTKVEGNKKAGEIQKALDAKTEEVLQEIGPTKEVRERIIKGRVAEIDSEIKGIDNTVDLINQNIQIAQEAGKPTKALENKLTRLQTQRTDLDQQRADLLTAEERVLAASKTKAITERDAKALEASKKKVKLTGTELIRQERKNIKERVRVAKQSLKAGMKLAKADIKSSRKSLKNVIDESPLSSAEKKNLKSQIGEVTEATLPKAIERLNDKIEKAYDKQRRTDAVNNISRAKKRINKSKKLAVDYKQTVNELIDAIDLKNRQSGTLAKLQKSLDYFDEQAAKGNIVEIPKALRKKLEILDKTKLADVTTGQLESLVDDIIRLEEQGLRKTELLQAKRDRIKKERLTQLREGTVAPFNSKEKKRASLGESLTLRDKMQNAYSEGSNRAQRFGKALSPVDVFMDSLDGGKEYLGANFKIFKETVDKSYAKYLQQRRDVLDRYDKLTRPMKLKVENFERMGAWAALQQEGGREKLKATGLTDAELDGLTLSENEAKVYEFMRRELDVLRPQIAEVQRLVRNEEFVEVDNYFSFMTDYDAMSDAELRELYGNNVEEFGQANRRSVQDKGFTKKRVGGKQKIRIDADEVFRKHIDRSSYFVNMEESITSLSDIANSQEYADIAGDAGQTAVAEWIDLLARKGRDRSERVGALEVLRKNTGAAILAYKLSTVLVQPTALMDGAALVGGANVMNGAKDIATSKAWRQFILDNFPEVRERVGDDSAYLDFGGKGKLDKIQDAGFWAMKNVDMLAASSVAAAAYTKAVRNKGGVVDLANPDPEAITYAELMVRRTQASGQFKDAPAVTTRGTITGNSSIDKLAFQFQTFMLNRWSVISHDMPVAFRDGRTIQAVNIAAFLLLANVGEVGLRRLSKELVALITDDELDPWEDSVEDEFVRSLFGNIPIVGNITGSFEYGSNPVPALSLLEKMFEKGSYAVKSKSPEKQAKHATGAALIGAGALVGVPGVLQAEQLSRNVFDK